MKRQTIGYIFIAMLGLLLVACSGNGGEAQVEELTVLNWQGYGSDEAWAVEQFEEEYGVTVTHDYFNSLDEMLTKLRTSPGTYDVVQMNIAYVPPAVEDGLIQPLDVDEIEGWENLTTDFQNLEEINIDGEVYAVPWAWGATSLVYNTEVYPDGITSLDELWNDEYAGQVGIGDYYEDNVIFAALAEGLDNPANPDDVEAVQARLEDLTPNVNAYWASEDEFNRLFGSGEITVGTYWSGSASRALTTFDLPIAFVIPEEGAIGWVDTWTIPTDAPGAELADEWIEFMTSPEFYLRWDSEVGAPIPANTATFEQLPEDSFNKQVFGDPPDTGNLAFMTFIEEEKREDLLAIWEEAKAE